MPAHNFEPCRGRIVELSIESAAIADNRLGDPACRTVAAYLPADYDTSDADYPVMVDLAGFTGSGLKRLAWHAFGESVPQRIDRLVSEGKMGPVIAVFPDGFTSLGGNQYVDSSVLGRWSTFLVADLIPRIETEFRVRRGRRHRAVYGKSSGGYGALMQGITHSEHWWAVACHSGDMAFEWVYLRDFPGVLDQLARFGGSIEGFLEHVARSPKLRGSEFHTLMILAMAASYDPGDKGPLGIRLPVDPHTCELDPIAWERWLAHDPVRILERSAATAQALASLGLLYLDCGRRDQYFLHYGARAFARRLQHLNIPHIYQEFDDDHSNIDYRLDESLPRLYAAIAE